MNDWEKIILYSVKYSFSGIFICSVFFVSAFVGIFRSESGHGRDITTVIVIFMSLLSIMLNVTIYSLNVRKRG